MNQDANESFGMWGILELMGHVRVAGYITEVELFGGKMGRIDIPVEDGADFTQFFGGHTVYRITPVSEEVARMFATRNQHRPVRVYELQLPAPEPATAVLSPYGRDPLESDDDLDDEDIPF